MSPLLKRRTPSFNGMYAASIIVCVLVITLTIAFARKYLADDHRDIESFLDKYYGCYFVKSGYDSKTHTKFPLFEIFGERSIRPPKDCFQRSNEALDKHDRDILSNLYEGREEAYLKYSNSITMLLQSLLALVVVGILVIFYRPMELEVPFVSIKVPESLFYIFITSGIGYVWFRCGLLLHAAIDARLALKTMTDTLEQIGNRQVHYYFSNARTLVDQGIVDTWCTYYYNIFKGGTHEQYHIINAAGSLYSIYGIFWGVAHGTCFILLFTFYEIKNKNKLCWLLFMFPTSVFLLWWASLLLHYEHSVFLMIWIWSVALISIILWHRYGRKIATDITAGRTDASR